MAACPDCTAWHLADRPAPAAVPPTDDPQPVRADEAVRTQVTAAA
jgi:hypothetical protein